MLRALLGLGARTTPRVPDDCVVYAIGDIHGRADLLGPLLRDIEADLEGCGASRRVVIFLGDYVDRGPASNRVLDILAAFAEESVAETRFIRGNHEDCLLTFMSEPATGSGWCEFGGRETLWSYGVTPPARRAEPEVWAAAAQALSQALPSTHMAFLSTLEPWVEVGDFFFTHAGARPGVALADQSDHDLMWIRGEFLGGTGRFERIVVHGHTPEPAVFADHRRVGLDTGAYATGVLTALRLQGSTTRLVQTRVDAGEVTVGKTAVPKG
ncbi:MAG: metallophosphoesterase [Brevundimonas sp.]|nr:metallophosphoesterase [Brevundimonas sp.]